jgi:lysozyme family protein
MTIDDIINAVIKAEGGYVNDPRDPGGETIYGITIGTARANGYAGKMRDMPRATAFEIYRARYVIAPGFGLVANLSALVAAEVVDTGVNMGPPVAGRFLQRALNGLVDGVTLAVDGNVGPQTIAALRAFLDRRGKGGELRLVALLNAQQGTRYLELAEGRVASRAFLYGWLARIMP